jgi:hypothetical protein
MAEMIARSWMSSEIDWMSNSPWRIYFEHSLNSKGPMCLEIGPLTKGVSVA